MHPHLHTFQPCIRQSVIILDRSVANAKCLSCRVKSIDRVCPSVAHLLTHMLRPKRSTHWRDFDLHWGASYSTLHPLGCVGLITFSVYFASWLVGRLVRLMPASWSHEPKYNHTLKNASGFDVAILSGYSLWFCSHLISSQKHKLHALQAPSQVDCVKSGLLLFVCVWTGCLLSGVCCLWILCDMWADWLCVSGCLWTVFACRDMSAACGYLYCWNRYYHAWLPSLHTINS